MSYFCKKHIILSLFIVILVSFELPLFSQFIEGARGQRQNEQTSGARWPAHIAYNIKVNEENVSNRFVIITWEANPEYKGRFTVFKSSSVIDNIANLYHPSTTRLRQIEGRNVAVDNALEGINFYAVIAEEVVGSNSVQFITNVNYISSPLIVSSSVVNARTANNHIVNMVSGIDASLVPDGHILIRWNAISDSGHIYTIYRSRNILDTPEKVHNAEKIGEVQDNSMFLDESVINSGTYFYAITARRINGEERILLVPRSTFTMEGIFVNERSINHVASRFRVNSIRAILREDQIVLLWEHTGSGGSRFFRVFRTRTRPVHFDDIRDNDIIDDVDITSGHHELRNPPSGEWYYGIAPYPHSVEPNFAFIQGVNVILGMSRVDTNQAEYQARQSADLQLEQRVERLEQQEQQRIAKQKEKELAQQEQQRLVRQAERREIITDEIVVVEDEVRPPVSEPKPRQRVRPQPRVDVDTVLERTFFSNRYKTAIKELDSIVKTSSNERDVAKAKLFIGRSYAELGDHQKALGYFLSKDVVRFFPKEASFWRDNSILRLN